MDREVYDDKKQKFKSQLLKIENDSKTLARQYSNLISPRTIKDELQKLTESLSAVQLFTNREMCWLFDSLQIQYDNVLFTSNNAFFEQLHISVGANYFRISLKGSGSTIQSVKWYEKCENCILIDKGGFYHPNGEDPFDLDQDNCGCTKFQLFYVFRDAFGQHHLFDNGGPYNDTMSDVFLKFAPLLPLCIKMQNLYESYPIVKTRDATLLFLLIHRFCKTRPNIQCNDSQRILGSIDRNVIEIIAKMVWASRLDRRVWWNVDVEDDNF